MKQEEKRKRIYKRMKELRGKLRQKTKGGNYYYRLTIANGLRKEFALKTSNEDEAVQKAADLDAVYEAPNQEVAFAQINAIKGFSRQAQMLPLAEGWNKYEKHPNRAMPHTVSEHLSYKKTYEDFVEFVSSPDRKVPITSIAEVESSTASEFADFMRQKAQAVDTHNRKIKRLRKIFSCLSDYYSGDNPFAAKSLLRSMREEQSTTVRRQAFSSLTPRQVEQRIRQAMLSSPHKFRYSTNIEIQGMKKRVRGYMNCKLKFPTVKS
ncbi:MAG: hypothetical protein E7057_02935 [Lentisphaerae bacterium]|nr:hypothetical protein [Lentisphaerota bacterium]